jgi:hypothetical protein
MSLESEPGVLMIAKSSYRQIELFHKPPYWPCNICSQDGCETWTGRNKKDAFFFVASSSCYPSNSPEEPKNVTRTLRYSWFPDKYSYPWNIVTLHFQQFYYFANVIWHYYMEGCPYLSKNKIIILNMASVWLLNNKLGFSRIWHRNSQELVDFKGTHREHRSWKLNCGFSPQANYTNRATAACRRS